MPLIAGRSSFPHHIMHQRSRRFSDVMGSRRRGVVYNMDEEGRARLVFESASSFEGTLETKSGEILSIRGIKGTRDDVVNIQVIDAETGSQFLLEDATIKYDGQSATIVHPALDYTSDERLIGMKARKEIQEYLNPRLAEEDVYHTVFKGHMKVKLLTSYQTKPAMRRESVCEDSTTIIEESTDFFA